MPAEVENSLQESKCEEEKAKKAITDVSCVLSSQRCGLETRKGLLSQGLASRSPLLSPSHSVVVSWRDGGDGRLSRGRVGGELGGGRTSP